MKPGRRESARRTGWTVAVGSIGTVLAAVQATHLREAGNDPLETIGIVIPLGLSLGLVVGAWWLYASAFDGSELRRIAAWMATVGVASIAVVVPPLGYDVLDPTVTGHNPAYVFANTATAGAVFGLLLGVYDSRLRRRAAELAAARDAKERDRDRFATLFENVPSPTIVYEYVEDVPVTMAVNPAFEEVFGYDADRVVGDPIDDHIVPHHRADEAERLNDRLRGEDVQVEITRQTADGPREFLLYTVSMTTNPDRGFATYVDISEQRRREQRLQVLNRVLRHDLRNAMNVVLGHADRMLETNPDDDGALAIRDRADELLRLCDKARTIERLLERESTGGPVEIGRLVADHAAAARDRYPQLDVSTALPPAAAWAPGGPLLGAALDNLLENAALHGGDDPTVEIAVEFDEGTDSERTSVRVVVDDDGPGIPDPELDILERGTETPLEHGSGIGLWLVTWIVEDAGGEVAFETTETGTRTTIALPAVEPMTRPRVREFGPISTDPRSTASTDD
ncbi:MAG: PAS domain-containing sensor histidine kinase [Haloferacaceae archaeon]